MSEQNPDPVAFPVLSDSEMDEMAAYGSERPTAAGELLFVAGDAMDELYVVLAGGVEVFRTDGDDETVIVSYARGGFVGELNLLTGQRRFTSARVTEDGRVLAIPQESVRRLMNARPALADKIFNALVRRREILREGPGADVIRIFGSRYSAEAMRLRSFAEHSRLAHTWIDIEEDAEGAALLASLGYGPDDTPVAQTPNGVLTRATPAQFAASLGLTYEPVPGYVFDLVIVGSGPAGLAAAVYGASEGLRTVALDAVEFGGQAGSSSRIENYAGFPDGISGGDLMGRTAGQAMRLGAQLNAPSEVTALRAEGSFHVVALADGSEIPTQSVIIASGARYLRLPVEDLKRFEDAGVFYAATNLEVRVCGGEPVIVVGGGNSAGQAALFLAQSNCAVVLAVRRDGLEETMSRYLIERIDAEQRIRLLTGVEVRALAGDEQLEQVTLEPVGGGERLLLACAGLFCFIGARPATTWLPSDVALDEDGFVLTDRDLPGALAAGALPFETSVPGIFAAGDVRHGSIKRVAVAVGEGSSAVRSVHERLAAQR